MKTRPRNSTENMENLTNDSRYAPALRQCTIAHDIEPLKKLFGEYEVEWINENYPAKSDLELKNEDLQRENDCAADEIVRLSDMIVELGFDPTIKS